MPRDLVLQGGYNIRDLGGCHTQDKRITRYGVFVRAGNMDKLTLSAQQQLLDYGTQTIIDLRNEWEAEHFPNPFARIPAVTYINLPLIGDVLSQVRAWKTQTDAADDLSALYIQYLAGCRPQIGAIINAMAEHDGCTVFHCHAGKDRTGITAALVLKAVGVENSVIADDYAASETHIAFLTDQWRQDAQAQGRDMARFERLMGTKAESISKLLDTIETQHGGIETYLAGCGVTKDTLSLLKHRFVEDSTL